MQTIFFNQIQEISLKINALKLKRKETLNRMKIVSVVYYY